MTQSSRLSGRCAASVAGPGTRPAYGARARGGSCLLALLLAVPVAQAQLVLMPGEYRENVAAAGRVIEATSASGLVGRVSFSRADALTQNMRLSADASTLKTSTAKGRGMLHVDFCVPRSGQAACDAQSDPAAPDILVNLTFQYGMVGEVISNFGSRASFSSSAALVDLERNQYVAYQALDSLSVSQGTIKTIKKVPVPLPNFAAGEETLPVTFSTFLRRGKVYRFQLAGATSATSTSFSHGVANFSDFVLQHPTQQGRVQLHNLRIQVGQEAPGLDDRLAELQKTVDSLKAQVGALADRVDLIDERFDDEFAGMSEAMFDLSERTAGAGAMLLRIEGAAAPEGARFVGRFRLVPGGGGHPGPPLRVDAYLMPPAGAAPAPPTPAASRRR
jgi:hypothetical protein